MWSTASETGVKCCLSRGNLLLCTWKELSCLEIRELQQRRRRRQRERQKATGLVSKTTNLHVHLAFLYISQPPLQEYDVKMPNFTFYGGRKQATTNFSLSKLKGGPQEINSKEIRPLLTFQANWHKRGKVWKHENSFLKWRFRCRRHRRRC